MDKPLRFECKKFEELSNENLYSILKLRQEVFIVEQNCPYLDCDGKDIDSLHLSAFIDGKLAAYARLIPGGISYPEYSSIGRVITSPEFRLKGLGKVLMKEAIKQMKMAFPEDEVKISSQVYIMKFYEDFGFKPVGDTYLEDDIPHIAMILKLDN